MSRSPRHLWDPSQVAKRPWTRDERRIVLRGWLGRLTIAIEPFFLGLFFAFLPIGMRMRHQDMWLFVAPIFGMAALAFVIYAIALMVPATRALLETFSPVLVVDGYVRYRRERKKDGLPEQFHVAVLSADREELGEWNLREWPTSIGEQDTWPVIVEFTPFGGIHKIDGRSTGVLPTDIAPFGIGVTQHEKARGKKPRAD